MSNTAIFADQDFLNVLRLRDTGLVDRLEREAQHHQELLGLGWSLEEITLAVKTGYNTRSHTDSSATSWWPNKRGYGADDWLDGWLEHHYRCFHGNKADMSFEEFVTAWQEIAELGCSRHCGRPNPYRAMKLYMFCRRQSLDHAESTEAIKTYGLENIELYATLRTRFRRETAHQMLWACLRGYSRRATAREVMKALRRGASLQDVVESLARGTLPSLAYRSRQQTDKQPSSSVPCR